ncbi:hypothetical protein NM688_g4708 [Phlebia brevispora]|uniref:Uncharacterized protein n=1 Tax=Phlebia brevispora TaxID=194682 RepID=A0ACC1T263_9APHY|nr:hypothetical protein NM688_g4708 [Phlebia brevispora]
MKVNQTTGEDISVAAQSGPIDPVGELLNHLQVNNPSANEHLFSHTKYLTRPVHSARIPRQVPLMKAAFEAHIHAAAADAKVPCPSGHFFHIGSTLEYLLRGISFEMVKTLGRWKSEAFLQYLRRHAQVLAIHLQDRPSLQDELM